MALKYSALSRRPLLSLFASISVPEVCKHGATAVPWNLPATWEKRNTANTAAVMKEHRADLITHYYVMPCYQLILIPLTPPWGCPSEQLGNVYFCICCRKSQNLEPEVWKAGEHGVVPWEEQPALRWFSFFTFYGLTTLPRLQIFGIIAWQL